MTEPLASDVNVDTIVLLCSETVHGRVLELDLYLSDPDFLVPNGADPRSLKDDPSVEIAVEGRTFPADLLFADGYVVVANAVDRHQPFLSDGLLDALQYGRTMVLRFDLLREAAGQPRRFDSSRSTCASVGRRLPQRGAARRRKQSRRFVKSTTLDARQWAAAVLLLGCSRSRKESSPCRR